MTRRQILLFLCLILISSCLLVREAWAGREKSYLRTLENYDVPDVTLINQDGIKMNLRKLLTSDGPILVDFVYTTCTTICPVLSVNFANFQKTIIGEHGTARLVSISIDPEFDTPRAMKAYLKRYHAQPGWDYVTGTRDDISRVLKAFKVFTQDKMDHYPVILLKSPVDTRWVRVNGLVGTSELLVEYEKVRK
jgi:protein SCO1/2